MRKKLTQSQRILGILRRRSFLRASDLEPLKLHRYALSRLLASGKIERFGCGLYRLPGRSVSELLPVAARAPHAVFCLTSALYIHKIIPKPSNIWIATTDVSHIPQMDFCKLEAVSMTGEVFSTDIEEYEFDGVTLRVYGLAKTVADCFKHLHRVGLDVAWAALKKARRRRVKMSDLWRAAEICRVTKVMSPYLKAVD